MILALAVMRVQWRWAALILLSTLVQAAGAMTNYMHVSIGAAANHVLETLLFPALFLSLTAYLYERSTREAFLANHLLGIERAKSDALLHNVLPHAIADRLKGSSDIVADDHANVTVLFADVVDFTPFCADKSAREVVGFLNDLFSRFDRLVEGNGLEKIKTVGDCYMVIAGAPTPRTDHAEAIAFFALELQAEARRVSEETCAIVQFRIGIHTGPLVAGVIGEKRFLYDVWGDTVNTASRLESQGVPGRIQVSEEVADRLKGRFALSYRGPVEIKGKGELEVWFLDGEAPQLLSDKAVVVGGGALG
jgi:adenylate cyclase